MGVAHSWCVSVIEAEKDGRAIADGEVLTACQSICPTNAITFGDMNDAASEIARVKKDGRNYNLLNELNTQPRTTYMADMRNQNPEMPDYVAPKVHAPAAEHGETEPAGAGH